MLAKLIKRIENPKWPLLGPNIFMLKKIGIIQEDSFKTRILNFMTHLLAGLIILAEYIEFWTIKHDHELALRNLSFSLLASVCMAKAVTFILWHKDWLEIINFATDTEIRQRSLNDQVLNDIINAYIQKARKIDNYYAMLVVCTVSSAILLPLIIYILGYDPNFYLEIVSLWVPFNRFHPLWQYIYYGFGAYLFLWGGFIVWSYDTFSFTMTIFFCGQFKILKANCQRIFTDENGRPVNDEEATKRLIECKICHMELMKYCNLMDSLLSPVMFFYVVICSLMICASAIRLTQDHISTIEAMWITEFLMALILQLFMYAWHCNDVTYISEEISYGPFSSVWFTRNVKMRRLVHLLAGQLNKTVIFTAGPFTHLNLRTFINILKASYSYYTLLK